jgi:2-oxoglutarate ferredoxin oxidoreductase subunit beta
MGVDTVPTQFKPGDYRSDLKPVWCPGCGDYGVVAALYRAYAELQVEPWNAVTISGIGCSSRLPGYVATYGFNSVHGRALPIALGVKMARPELRVVAVGGDGDGFAIGGNHFMHAARRNTDLFYIVMDNEIYGLTKGQAAPTTPTGDKTKSTFWGNPEPSIDPCELAISVGATWVGRANAGDLKGMVELMTRALRHRGFAFLNVMSPCVTWRGDDQFKELKAKQRPIPADHDAGDRVAAMKYTREKEIMSVGVLYEVNMPTLVDRVSEIRAKATAGGGPVPSTIDIAKTYFPKF